MCVRLLGGEVAITNLHTWVEIKLKGDYWSQSKPNDTVFQHFTVLNIISFFSFIASLDSLVGPSFFPRDFKKLRYKEGKCFAQRIQEAETRPWIHVSRTVHFPPFFSPASAAVVDDPLICNLMNLFVNAGHLLFLSKQCQKAPRLLCCLLQLLRAVWEFHHESLAHGPWHWVKERM